MSLKTILKVEDLTKYFVVGRSLFNSGEVVKAVDGVSFSLMQGETLSLVGESGCGKSTTGRLVLRLIPPTRGTVIYQGQDIAKLPADKMRKLRSDMQIIFQDPWSSLNPRMTVKEIIGEGLRRQPELSRAQRKKMVLEMMETVGLRPEHYDRHPHEFSGGQRQRLGVARALIMRPKLVVADEPLSALDVSVQAQVVNLLARLKRDLGLSYLFISHDLAIVEHISDRIAVMYLGKLMELASKRQLFAQPRHPYTQALFSAAPTTEVGREKNRIILSGDVPSPLNPPKGCRFHTRCPLAQEDCGQLEPEFKLLAPGHWVACHHPLND
ncbi:MAG: dipeptide ABC transporter ATP-binding protein [Desulfarculus sp.]|nr:dipeptide ABC transporter ATP-binding protein [Pseudomonadota bacterium]MBU4574736.1 dipeptide ABC transporter ATP-binding protein [Pseudomonadota bacterium]MBU4596706.1 dipeptide ABC transporter ATP-binding protein [Pseudomonadota bacterium]MBV1715316.1 dipeptide ABC transporter ATP-binding protein [Desulfarculus sp.]MBV1740523.1 dipeptide ABC transporter ATP-binding protein [Desulfarculus sp.]